VFPGARRGDHLLRYLDINQPQAVNQGGPANRVRPFLGYGLISMGETTAQSRYRGLLTFTPQESRRDRFKPLLVMETVENWSSSLAPSRVIFAIKSEVEPPLRMALSSSIA
jgi:hypothetical protein